MLDAIDNSNDDAESSHGMLYRYDALGRRVSEASYGNLDGDSTDLDNAGTTFFYSNRWQVLEEDASYYRPHGATADLAAKQATYVWSPDYVDELIERDVVTPNPIIDGGGEGEGVGGGDTDSLSSTPFDAQTIADAPDGRLYAQQDANYNVTSLVSPHTSTSTPHYQYHTVEERDAYDAYGEPTFLDSSFTPLTNSSGGTTSGFAFTVLNQGTMFDANADLYHVRYRVLKNGRWAQEDPAGYIDSANGFSFEGAQPIISTDHLGLYIDDSTNTPEEQEQIRIAIAYLVKSKKMIQVIGGALLDKRTVRIVIIHDDDDRFVPGDDSDTIYWDPNSALKTTDGGHQSPALGLGHEIGHFAGWRAWHAFLRRLPKWGYDTREEQRNIDENENVAANELGESGRSDHRGDPYWVPDPTDR